MFWIETKTPEDAKHIQDRMWGIVESQSSDGLEFRVRGEGLYENNEFWGDAICKVKDPHKRLNMAMKYLPLPGAFYQAAISLRAIIREKRKRNIEFESDLKPLFHLAAILSFCIPYAIRLQQPGYNVFARVPFAEFNSMSLTWEALGYEKLNLLNKTDRKWMVEAWGEPQVHTTAHEKYLPIWNQYEERLINESRLAP